MSSTHEPFYWDSTALSLAGTTSYQVVLPTGTTEWTVTNGSGSDILFAGSAATVTSVATPGPYVTIRHQAALTGKGQSLFVSNRNGGVLAIGVIWGRPGRQPFMDAGTATLSAPL